MHQKRKQFPYSHTNLLQANLFFLIFLLIYLFVYLFIYLFLAVLGLRCCMMAFPSCGKWELLFVVVHELLIVVPSLVAGHRL